MSSVVSVLTTLFQQFFLNLGMWIGIGVGWVVGAALFPESPRSAYQAPHGLWDQITDLTPGMWCIIVGAAVGAWLWKVTRH